MAAIWVGESSPATRKKARVKALIGHRKNKRFMSRLEAQAAEPKKARRRNGMDISWLTDRIAVGGGIWNAGNMADVARTGITHIIDMQCEFDDTPLAVPWDITVLWNPTDDDFEPKPPELFGRGVKFAQAALEAEGKLFIHCAAGVHRGPMMASAVLARNGWNLRDAMDLITARRPLADFPEVYVQSVERFLES